ncbi:MAG TPA: Zn-dependent hydrolase [Anaerolineales bacterium]|nr:Zn-dependent hydrolase [Anaerolineales bacterium]
MQPLSINPSRFREHFEALAVIGATGDGGVHRPALSEAHLSARRWFKDLILADGFEFSVDGAGNQSARLPCGNPGAKTLLMGSHLDSVPYGGRFDGPLGVLAAYEVLLTIRDAGIELPVHLEAIDFTDEEGTLVGLLGSRALARLLKPEDLESPRGGRDRLLEGLGRAGLTEDGLFLARRNPESLAGFLEIHIEQGPRLVEAGLDIGIVDSLVGIGSLEITFLGRADHAGTTPMGARLDASLGLAEFTLAARRLVMDEFPGCVCNGGKVSVQPGVLNIVPERAKIWVEYRSPAEDQLETLRLALIHRAGVSARVFGLAFEVKDPGRIPTTPCAVLVQGAFAKACDQLGLASLKMNSGAGHDTMAMASVCPAGMIFIPSSGGSHSPTEFARHEDCVNGANVLLHAALELAMRSP